MTAPSANANRVWWVLAAMCVPLLAQSLDVSGIGLLLPSIGHDLDADAGQLAWVMNANALAFGALLLTFGRLADRFGPRRLLLAGVAGFGAASLLCGAAPSTPLLIGARALQGLASAACFTTSLSVVMATFDERRRPAAIGVWGAVSGAGSALGPLVAGALTTAIGWRAFFLVNGPLCLLALPAIASLLDRDELSRPRADRVPAARMAALAVAYVAVSLAAGGLGGDRRSIVVAAVLLLVAVAAAGAVAVARRRGSPPLLDPAALAGPWSRPALAIAFTSTWGFGVTLVVVSAYLQEVRGSSALDAGIVFLAYSGAFALAGPANGPVVRRFGLTAALAGSAVVSAAGFALLVPLGSDTPLLVIVLGLLVGGYGAGMAFDASTTASLAQVPEQVAGETTGAVQTVRLLGNVVGVALSTALVVEVSGGSEGATDLARGDRAAMVLALVVALVGVAATLGLARRRPAGTAGSVVAVPTAPGHPARS